MEKQNTVIVGWKKSWVTAASTYMVEIENGTVWFGRLGSGGAHWNPNYAGLRMREVRQRDVGGIIGTAVGKAVGNKILGKFQKEIEENAGKYESGGRAALSHKANMEHPVEAFASAAEVSKLPGNAPPAMKSEGGPYVEAKLGGKTYYFSSVPGAPPVEDFLDAVQ